mmetsp:Transcript_80800/g.158644  ORF Transcript_80800/g.158644 Transcript_80800/m.158644 type:complete len:428 (+) Transcript_80800:159-1442(+)
MSVVRFKYRQAAIQPELTVAKENASLSLAKKKKVEEPDPYADLPKVNNDQTIFLATHTQVKRVEVLISSNEEAYRKKHYPTIEERIEKQKEWAGMQLREAKIASEREALKKAMELKVISERKKMDSREAAKRDGIPPPHEDEENVEVDPMIPDEPLGPGGLPLTDIDAEDDTNALGGDGDAQGMNAEYAEELLDIKERKLLASRNTLMYHREWSRWERRKYAWKVQYGWMGKRDRDLTEVLPWLLLGRREVSSNQSLLLQHGVTHILNMTSDIPCAFPNTFIYQRVPIKDNLKADIASHFATIINFIKRAEKCKGRILVHCTIGASRAPTAVLAYLIYVRGIPLVDAYNYIMVLRPLVMPNQHFLFELAKFECELGEGSSVMYHKEWRFYEFNVFRAEGFPERRSLGLYKTAFTLQTKQADEDDLLA